MSLFFPDVNVWLALSDDGHAHNSLAWRWREQLSVDARLVFSRHTQIGLLRLLTNSSVMSRKVMTLREAWALYDRWIEDASIAFYPEPRFVDEEFRRFTAPFGGKAASNWVGDCWILAFAHSAQSRLVTFDKVLYDFARKHGHEAVIPS